MFRNLNDSVPYTLRIVLCQSDGLWLLLYIEINGMINLYAKYIMWNAGLAESQVGIKTASRNSNNLRYADNTILKMAENEEEWNSLLMKQRMKKLA